MVLLSATVVLALACGGGGGFSSPTMPDTRSPSGSVSCGTTRALFSTSPVALEDMTGWVPLGNIGPPGHTFSTDHQYLYLNNTQPQAARREVALVAPSDLVVTRIRRATTTPGITDYTLEFSPCAEVYGQFGHVASIEPTLLSQVGSFDQMCESYSPIQGTSIASCQSRAVAVRVRAGAPLGTAGGAAPHSIALDFWLWDARVPLLAFVNPLRWSSSNDRFDQFHVAPASDYFTEPLASQVAARVGRYDGLLHRTATPLGGTIMVDVPGSAMGYWFAPSQPTYPESVHLAIAPDNLDPSRVAFSIGTSLEGWSRGLVIFAPSRSGFVNRDPAAVTADGSIHCYESAGVRMLLLQLVDVGTLRLEKGPAGVTSCATAAPWTFSPAAVDYKR